MRLILLVITLSLSGLISMRAHAVAQTVPLCLVGFCLDSKNLPTQREVRSRFGGSNQKSSHWGTKAYCYKFILKGQKARYGQFEFKMDSTNDWRLVTIRLSQESLCVDPHVVQIKSAFSMNEGISLGCDEAEMKRLYGQPTYVINQPRGALVRDFFGGISKTKVDVINQYISGDEKDLSSARFYFSNKKLVGIEMSVDE